MLLDLHWWSEFLPKWNGISIIHTNRAIRHLWTDVPGTKGQGSFTEPGINHQQVSWENSFSQPLSSHHRAKDINFKEMHTVLLVNQRQLPCFKHYKLVIFTDNTTVLGGLRYRSVRGPAMDPLCEVAPLAALYDSNLPTVIPTHENILADLVIIPP